LRKKITKIKLSDQIFETIKQMIFVHQYLPGETLQIDRLAREFEVSTTPIREALLKLESEGLVEISPNKSAIVTRIDESSVRDLWGLRNLLESDAARSVAVHCEQSDIEELEKEFHKLLKDPEDMDLYIKTEKKLDELMFKYTYNKLVKETLQNLKQRSERLMYFTTEEGTGYLRVKEAIIMITREHLDILDAFKKRDPDLARKKVQTHVMNGMERTIDAIRNYTLKEQS